MTTTQNHSIPKRPLRKVDPGIYETADERYAAFKSTSQWNVSGRKGAVEALAVDLAAAQAIVHAWMVEDAEEANGRQLASKPRKSIARKPLGKATRRSTQKG